MAGHQRPGGGFDHPPFLAEVLPGAAIGRDRGTPARPDLVEVSTREQVMQILRRGVTDPSPAVRERTLTGLQSLRELWRSKGPTSLLLAALADDTPALRRLGLTIASTKTGFSVRPRRTRHLVAPQCAEYLKRLLIDPDPEVRRAALTTVERFDLIRVEPAFAGSRSWRSTLASRTPPASPRSQGNRRRDDSTGCASGRHDS